MILDIKARGFELDSELHHFASCCAAFEMGPQRSRIDSVRIRLTWMQESPDPRNRYCMVEVDLCDGHTLRVEDTDMDLHVAIYRALEHAGWSCAQWLSREGRGADSLPIHGRPELEHGREQPRDARRDPKPQRAPLDLVERHFAA